MTVEAQAHLHPTAGQELAGVEGVPLVLSRLSPEGLRDLQALERELLAILDPDDADKTTQKRSGS